MKSEKWVVRALFFFAGSGLTVTISDGLWGLLFVVTFIPFLFTFTTYLRRS